MRTACTLVLKASFRRYLAIRLSEMFPDDSLSLRLANATIPVAATMGRGTGGSTNGVRFVLERR